MTLELGIDLDAKVAKALGWERETSPEGAYPKEVWIPTDAPIKQADGSLLLSYWHLPPFSTDSGLAIVALEKFCKKPRHYGIQKFDDRRVVLIYSGLKDGEWWRGEAGFSQHRNDRQGILPHAICLAIVEASQKPKEG